MYRSSELGLPGRAIGREFLLADSTGSSKPTLNGLAETDTYFAKCRQLSGGADQKNRRGA
jgi:hypothetical protein